MTSTTVIDQLLHAIESATIPACDVWSTSATLDAMVPNWRLHAAGPDAIRAEYARLEAASALTRGPAAGAATATWPNWSRARPSGPS